MGRPRLTQNALILSGQNEKKPKRYSSYNLVPGEVIPKDVTLHPPKGYEKATKKAFKMITSNLIAMGALSEQDIPALYIMTDALNDYYKYEALLNLLDSTADVNSDDYLNKRDKLMRRKNEASDRFYRWTSRFGITPTERSKIFIQSTYGKDEDPLDILMGS